MHQQAGHYAVDDDDGEDDDVDDYDDKDDDAHPWWREGSLVSAGCLCL